MTTAEVIARGLEERRFGRPGAKSYGVRVELLQDLTVWNCCCERGRRAFLYPEQAEYLIALGAARLVVEGDKGEVRPRNTLRWWIRRRLLRGFR